MVESKDEDIKKWNRRAGETHDGEWSETSCGDKEEKIRREIVDNITLTLTQSEIEQELANMESLIEILVRKLRTNSKDKKQAEIDVKELTHTFDVAMTAMQMIWLVFEGDKIIYD